MKAYALDVFRAAWMRSDGDLAAAVEAVYLAGLVGSRGTTRRRSEVEEAMREVCERLGFDLAEIKSPDRSRVVTARRVRVWEALRARGFSYPLIGAATGDRCHTSVLTAIRRKGERASADDTGDISK